MAAPRLCSIPDCGKPRLARGLCSLHYQRVKRHGDPSKTNRKPPEPCSVHGCHRMVKAKGLCGAHLHRLRAHGSPTGGRTPVGTPLKFIENEVFGTPTKECIRWPFGENGVGYGIVTIDGDQMLVTRYICERVHGVPPSLHHEAAHLCGNGHAGCVNPAHLVWKTPSENQMDRVTHDTHQRGERHPLSKITEDDVRAIRRLEGKHSHADIAGMFGIGRVQVTRILSRDRWGWLD